MTWETSSGSLRWARSIASGRELSDFIKTEAAADSYGVAHEQHSAALRGSRPTADPDPGRRAPHRLGAALALRGVVGGGRGGSPHRDAAGLPRPARRGPRRG